MTRTLADSVAEVVTTVTHCHCHLPSELALSQALQAFQASRYFSNTKSLTKPYHTTLVVFARLPVLAIIV